MLKRIRGKGGRDRRRKNETRQENMLSVGETLAHNREKNRKEKGGKEKRRNEIMKRIRKKEGRDRRRKRNKTRQENVFRVQLKVQAIMKRMRK